MPNPPPEPLSPEREAEIRAVVNNSVNSLTRAASKQLLTEIDRLRAEVERLTERLENAGEKEAYLGRHEVLIAERDAARADAERLAGALLAVLPQVVEDETQEAWVLARDALRQHEEGK